MNENVLFFICHKPFYFDSIAEKTAKKALASITLEDQLTAIQRSQGLLDDDNPANRIGPTIPKPTTTSTYSSTAKTIQKPPQLSGITAKPMVTITAQPQRTIVTAPIIRPMMPPTAIIPQAAHPMMAMPPIVAVPQAMAALHQPPPMEEPLAKRSKTEDQLIPEEEFYKNYGRVNIMSRVYDFLVSFSILFFFRVKSKLLFNYRLLQKNPNGISMVKLFH